MCSLRHGHLGESFGRLGSTVGVSGMGGAVGGLERNAWTPLSVGRSKGGAWCHEVRVRLPAGPRHP